MKEYIEREEAIKEFERYGAEDDAIAVLNSIPAADVRPVVRGKWVSVPHKLSRVCSLCWHDEPYKFAEKDVEVYNYCPNCGAKMEES